MDVGFKLATGVSEADWLVERLARWQEISPTWTVGQVVPEGYDAYARIYHRAERRAPDGMSWEPLSWTELAEQNGKAVHAEMVFDEIANLERQLYRSSEPPPWLMPPFRQLRDDECQSLLSVLKGFTSTPERCYFCVWKGYGFPDGRLGRALYGLLGSWWRIKQATVRLPRLPGAGHRDEYTMFSGPLESIMSFCGYVGNTWWGQPPDVWWPEDRAWCVASDIDTLDTCVGGSHACIAAVLEHPGLETLPASLTDKVAW